MREILFRGKRTDNGEWIEGTYFPPANTLISYKLELIDGVVTFMDFCVIPETVGQFTGLTDKNGKKIFEGDIITMQKYGKGKHKSLVYFKNGKFAVDGSNYAFKDICPRNMEIIGNIYDNPELLKGGEE